MSSRPGGADRVAPKLQNRHYGTLLQLHPHHVIHPSELSLAISGSLGGGDLYSGQDLSTSQLLRAVRKKLQDTILGGRCVRAISIMLETTPTEVLQDQGDHEPE